MIIHNTLLYWIIPVCIFFVTFSCRVSNVYRPDYQKGTVLYSIFSGAHTFFCTKNYIINVHSQRVWRKMIIIVNWNNLHLPHLYFIRKLQSALILDKQISISIITITPSNQAFKQKKIQKLLKHWHDASINGTLNVYYGR